MARQITAALVMLTSSLSLTGCTIEDGSYIDDSTEAYAPAPGPASGKVPVQTNSCNSLGLVTDDPLYNTAPVDMPLAQWRKILNVVYTAYAEMYAACTTGHLYLSGNTEAPAYVVE